MNHDKHVTYTTYLKVDELLELQQPLSVGPEHDELLFITIHQVYELWFKQILHELDKTKVALSANRLFSAIHTFKRLRSIMRTLVGQVAHGDHTVFVGEVKSATLHRDATALELAPTGWQYGG